MWVFGVVHSQADIITGSFDYTETGVAGTDTSVIIYDTSDDQGTISNFPVWGGGVAQWQFRVDQSYSDSFLVTDNGVSSFDQLVDFSPQTDSSGTYQNGYSLVLQNGDSAGIGEFDLPYTGVVGFINPPAGSLNELADSVHAFNFVNTVPEPNTVELFVTGSLLLLIFKRILSRKSLLQS